MTKCIQHKALDLPAIKHGFFTREGGISQGRYSSLNCGFGSVDCKKAVKENQTRALNSLGISIKSLRTAWQVHSTDVITIKNPKEEYKKPKCDSLITNVKGLALGILTADCAPILFANSKLGIIGAAHAGWKGALGGILENTVYEMISLGSSPRDITAVVGPTIGPKSYEVGPDFRQMFLESSQKNSRFFRQSLKENHWTFDLPKYVQSRLEATGIGFIVNLELDTYAYPKRFFSYRRTCHQGGGDYGRLLSIIAMES